MVSCKGCYVLKLNMFYRVLQNASYTEESGDAMSFDECLQLLAETFPVEETEVRTYDIYPTWDFSLYIFFFKDIFPFLVQNTPVCLDTTAVSAPIMPPEQPVLPPATLSPAPLPPPPPPPQRVTPDLEQAWMELLSLPELQV